MTPDKTPSLLPCPFCGGPAHGYAIEPHSHSPAVLKMIPDLPDHPGSYVIEGQCACGSGLIGAKEAEVVARWNNRLGSPVVAGEPGNSGFLQEMKGINDLQPTQAQAGAVPPPKFLALKFHARRDKKATVTLLFNDHETADAWVRGIKGGQP